MINLYDRRTHNNIHDETFGKIKQYPLKNVTKDMCMNIAFQCNNNNNIIIYYIT